MLFNRLGTFTLGVIITAVSVGAVSYVYAADEARIEVCVNKTTGVMRYGAKASCKKTENYLSWNAIGPQGLPGAKGETGAAGAAGAKGDTGPAATATTTTTTIPSQKVGDIGPGGGPIFFVDTANLYPFTYLEAAPSNATEDAISCNISGLDFTKANTTSGPLTSDAFGQGQNNTSTLLAMCDDSFPIFSDFVNLVKQGWFIPSVAEMKLLVSSEKLGLISFSRPLRDPISSAEPALMTSSLYPFVSSGHATFWGWEATTPTNPGGRVTYETFYQNAIRLIRAT